MGQSVKHIEYSVNTLGLVFVMAFKKRRKQMFVFKQSIPQAYLQGCTLGGKQARSNHSCNFTQVHTHTHRVTGFTSLKVKTGSQSEPFI